MNQRLSLVPALLLAALPITTQQEVSPIRNFLRVNEQFCTGAQPRLEHLRMLRADGIKAIINLRPPGEHRAAEEEAEATEFLQITDDPKNRPAFIHCAAAIRVGAFWMIRRVLRDGWTVEAAEKEAEKIGLRESPHLNEFARQYIDKHRKKNQ